MPAAQIVLQKEQRGTADAANAAREALAGFDGDAVVLFGDTPFISEDTLRAVFDKRATGADVVWRLICAIRGSWRPKPRCCLI